MKKRTRKIILYLFLCLILIIIFLFLIRLLSARHLDDVSPEIPCDRELLEKSDVLYVIPKFNNKSTADNKEWCEYILSLNKTLGLHGVYHTYQEFGEERSKEYLEEGISIFEQCFGFKPERFKPPQLKISRENKNLIREMNLDSRLGSIFHKVYHCNDSGLYKNWESDLF